MINILIAYKLKTETKKAKKCKKQTKKLRLSKNESKNYQSFMKRDKFEVKPKKSVKFNDSLLISYKKETKIIKKINGKTHKYILLVVLNIEIYIFTCFRVNE